MVNPTMPQVSSAAPKPAGSAGAASKDPCTLNTKDEAQAALGLQFAKATVVRGGLALGGSGADCNYEGALPSDPSQLSTDHFRARPR